MSYLLFLDESGHDHKTMPYEVRGGVALHAKRLWPFVQAMQAAEEVAFGATLASLGTELKGHRLLDKDRFRWAAQGPLMDDLSRRKHAQSFLRKGAEKRQPTRDEFTAYGQASIEMARRVFQLLRSHDARLLAVAIPREAPKPPPHRPDEILRKDQVFLLERFFYLLQQPNETGLLVLDRTDKSDDRRLVKRIERYFSRTQTGRYRASLVVPSPLFVESDLVYPVQAADICIYCVNWGYRVNGMSAPVREEIASEFGPLLEQLEFHGTGRRDGRTYSVDGVVYVPDLYASRG
jgi:hypothetical protein